MGSFSWTSWFQVELQTLHVCYWERHCCSPWLLWSATSSPRGQKLQVLGERGVGCCQEIALFVGRPGENNILAETGLTAGQTRTHGQDNITIQFSHHENGNAGKFVSDSPVKFFPQKFINWYLILKDGLGFVYLEDSKRAFQLRWGERESTWEFW